MTTAFKDFLQKQAQKHQAEVSAGKATVQEWERAVRDLFDRMRAWLKASDSEQFFEIEESQEKITEKDLGTYGVPRLDLRAFGKWIGIIPKARSTVATARPPQKSVPERAAGRVDVTNELLRYVLYRFHEDGQDTWLIDDLKSEPRPLDQEAFERALMSYLQ